VNIPTVDLFYIEYLKKLISCGSSKTDRTNIGGNISIFGTSYHHIIEKKDDWFINLPFIQSRRFEPKNSFIELIWMLRGETNIQYLKDRGVNFWDHNTSVEFLSKNNKSHIVPNTIGKGYGYQMRNFNGIDQLSRVYTSLKNYTFSRRHVISFWNPSELQDMALEPCHWAYTFVCQKSEDDKIILNLHFNMRSSDFYLGFPTNIAFSSLWLCLFSKLLKYELGQVFYTASDVHIYNNQLKKVNLLIEEYKSKKLSDKNFCSSKPQIRLKKEITSLDDILNLEWEDIELKDFITGPKGFGVPMAI